MRFLPVILLFLTSCHAVTGFRQEHSKAEEITEIPREIRVPVKMWEALAVEGKEKPKEGGEAGYVFSEAKVILTEKNPGVLKEPSLKISFPRGGGEIDLSQYMGEAQGSFYVGLEVPETEEAEMTKILFISHSRKRKLDNQIYGSGCHEFFDITKTFIKEMKHEGLKVNTTRNRHTSTLGGTFILASRRGGQNYLTQVTFTDSANKNLLCQESEWKKF